MDVPQTVRAALADRPVEGAVCLEAGAGFGNAAAGLLDAGADRVYAVTIDRDHAEFTRDRCGGCGGDRRDRAAAAALQADARGLPLATDAVEVVTAHALFNALRPASLEAVVSELTRVAAPGCHLVVDDYDPLPADAAVRDLFAVENAASQLSRGRPAQTFYPASALRRSFVGAGWTVDRELTLLDPVPWTASHLAAHADAARSFASRIPGDPGARLGAEVDRLAEAVDGESTGRMYSLAFRLPG